jgi:hypothetical protein
MKEALEHPDKVKMTVVCLHCPIHEHSNRGQYGPYDGNR